MPRLPAYTQGSVPSKHPNGKKSRQPSSARYMKLVNDGPGGSIIIKGKKAREMHEEEIRKKAARVKERNMAEIEAALEKERRNIRNRLRMQEERKAHG
ncbi:uncharacterized protein IAS62_003718 [Cryptococcus decagattii]|uniref:rRNA-processing protein n=1 Tax=Cryptococcus decagattii TaxID=1859122 RepID=A0ABZ2AV42_9TREE